MNTLADRIAGRILDFFKPGTKPKPRHPAFEFISDVTDAATICVKGQAFLASKLTRGEYRSYVAGLPRAEQLLFANIKSKMYLQDTGGLMKTLGAMSDTLVTAEFISRKLVSVDAAGMEPELAGALERFMAKLPPPVTAN